MIVAGFGFRRGATLASLQDALVRAQEQCPALPVVALAAPDDKCGPVGALAARLGLTAIGVSPQTLEAAVTVTRSIASLAARRTGSVAEAAALAAVPAANTVRARLLVPRVVSSDRMATCAIAQGVES